MKNEPIEITYKERSLYVPIEKRAMRNHFWLESMIKGLKQFIDNKGGIDNCSFENKELLKKWEAKLKELKK